MSKKFKVKICSSGPGGSTSFFRTVGPFSKLRKLDPNVEVEFLTAIDWYMIADADVVFFERPIEDNFLTAILTCKHFNVPIWVDFDDDLLNIPPDHPQFTIFQTEKIRNNIKMILGLADVVTVTTESLKASFSEYNKNIIVIENAFDDYHYSMPSKCSDNPIVSWRGSDTHEPDLHEYEEAIWAAAKKHEKDWSWLFVGAAVPYIWRKIKNRFYGGMLPLVPFYRYMRETSAAVQIVPLKDNAFNHSKSNIGWLDGMVAGSVCVGPDFPEWDKPGVFTYHDNDSFIAAVELAMNPLERRAAYAKSRKYIIENLLLSKVNRKRLDIIYKF